MNFLSIEIPGNISSENGSRLVYSLLGGDESIFEVYNAIDPQVLNENISGDSSDVKLPVPLVLPLSNDGNSTILTASLKQTVSLLVEEVTRSSGAVEYKILGAFCDNFIFDKLADFMYINPVPVVYGRPAIPIIMNPNYPDISFLTNVRYVKPPLFTKPSHCVNSFLNYSSEINKNKLNDTINNEDYITEKGMNPVAKYSASTVPDLPLTAAMKLDPEADLIQRISALFERRPIWLRQAIHEFLPKKYSNWKKKIAFSRVCYLFLDGPWRGSLVKLGYDPRINVESSIYQTIDFRDPYYRSIKYKTELNRIKKESSEEYPNEETMDRIYGDNARDVIQPNLELHFLLPPSRPSQLYQLCDISDAKVQLLTTSKTSYSSQCSRTSGWYQPSVLVQIRQIMNVKSKLMRQQNQIT